MGISTMAANSGEMRKQGDWMMPPDDRLLETLRDEGNLTPFAISKEGEVFRVDISRKYAGVRLRALTRAGLVESVDRGLYRLSDKGRAYLDEEFDASTVSPDD